MCNERKTSTRTRIEALNYRGRRCISWPISVSTDSCYQRNWAISLFMSSSIDATVIQDEKSTGTVVCLHLKFLFSAQVYSLLLLLLIFMLLTTPWISQSRIISGWNRSSKSSKVYWYTITAQTASQAAGIYHRRLVQRIWKDAYNLPYLHQQSQKRPPKELITLTLYMENKDRQKTSTG